jgi:D-alanyl-D-alanine carboxypeptidase
MNKMLFALFIPLLAATAAHADSVDDFVRAQMESKHIPGVAIAVVKDGKAVKVRGYGVSNLELQTPVTPDTVFRIGSVSKQMLATGIMVLIKDGKLALNDAAVKFLDGAPASWNDITIRHLLTHTSGLGREGPAYDFLKVQSDADVIKSAYAMPLLFKPGERQQYSNLGYFVLAEIIAKVSGSPWPTFMQERVFAPLGMTATGIVDAAPVIPHRASGYVHRNGEYRNAATILALRPSGAFVSSMTDMLKWNAALDRAGLLPQETLEEMWKEVVLSDGSTRPYGFGFQIEKLGSSRAITHGGSLNGFRSWYLRIPDDRLSVIVLTNNEIAPTDAIAAGIASRYIKDLFPRYKEAKLKSVELEAFAGSYKLQSGSVATLRREGKALQLQSPGGMQFDLLPSSATQFFSPDDPRMRVEFEPNAIGTKFSFIMNGNVQMTGTKQ